MTAPTRSANWRNTVHSGVAPAPNAVSPEFSI